MSLDFYLEAERGPTEMERAVKLLEDAGLHKAALRLSCCEDDDAPGPLFTRNITHNLAKMASEAGVYACLWRPDENGITHARQMVEPLRNGLLDLDQRPEHFQQFNPKNGWGDYYGLKAFVRAVLGACEEHPDALVRASR